MIMRSHKVHCCVGYLTRAYFEQNQAAKLAAEYNLVSKGHSLVEWTARHSAAAHT